MSSVIGSRRYLTNFDVHRLPHLFTDVLVIGSGIAGLRAALAAAEQADVLVVTKDEAEQSATRYAQGGIAAAIAPPDSLEQHARDTLAVACGLGDGRVVQHVVRAAPGHIEELQRWGAEFDRGGESLALGREGGHTAARVVHANGDATGDEIIRVLLRRVREHPRIRLFEHCFAIDLLTHEGQVVGIVSYHPQYGHQMFWATTTVLATGGVGRVYRETTNQPVATGDGLAIAFRAGAVLRDLELVQFHPTTLYVAGAARALVSEAVRGEGAYLVHRDGERFMHKYDEREELTPRDIVSRAISAEMKLRGVPNVYLDVRHLPPGKFATRFPTIHKLCREFDIDPEQDLIPVRPSAHYTIGGVVTDIHAQTSLVGLLACGEVACTGVNGANRLASNSLLEGLVFGEQAGCLAGQRTVELGSIDHPLPLSHLLPQSPRTQLDVDDVLHSLRSVMSRNVAIERSADRLRETIEIIVFWSRYIMDKVFDTPGEWEIQNLLTVALCTATAAAARCESRGVHYRTDFPQPDDRNWLAHVDLCRADHGIQLSISPHRGAAAD
ncbi:MAG: L-aspartate oxidase [Planctomycetes bacterium]|nr:L-aspartate oxidase [Planctomycetota bacterium]